MQNTKTDRLEARISRDQRAVLERGARLAGTSLSAFVIDAAMDRAEELVAERMSTSIPADYFDRVLQTLDEADAAPALAKAARRAAQRPRISTQ